MEADRHPREIDFRPTLYPDLGSSLAGGLQPTGAGVNQAGSIRVLPRARGGGPRGGIDGRRSRRRSSSPAAARAPARTPGAPIARGPGAGRRSSAPRTRPRPRSLRRRRSGLEQLARARIAGLGARPKARHLPRRPRRTGSAGRGHAARHGSRCAILPRPGRPSLPGRGSPPGGRRSARAGWIRRPSRQSHPGVSPSSQAGASGAQPDSRSAIRVARRCSRSHRQRGEKPVLGLALGPGCSSFRSPFGVGVKEWRRRSPVSRRRETASVLDGFSCVTRTLGAVSSTLPDRAEEQVGDWRARYEVRLKRSDQVAPGVVSMRAGRRRARSGRASLVCGPAPRSPQR
jgi:hypothetical protein